MLYKPLLLLLLISSVPTTPTFDVLPLTGVNFVLENSATANKYLVETMGGGVALLDYNNDGLLDIFLVNGGALSRTVQKNQLFDRSNPKYRNRLYRQEKTGTFTDVTQAAGLSQAGEGNYGMGAAVGDFDNDGLVDLYVTSYGKNVLYHNNGNGTFSDVSAKAGVAAGGWSASAGFFDYDNDGYLDLFVTRYLDWSPTQNKDCGGAFHTYCPPAEYAATTNVLFHNNHDGTFTDVSLRSGIGVIKARSLGVAFNDYDGDGYTDVVVANDAMQQFLFHNNRNGTFSEVGLEAGVSLSDDGKPISGMGVDFRDYDNDGRPDIVITDLAKQMYGFYHNDGGGSFTYRSLESGLGALSAGSSGWGVAMQDFDNDGWKDLFVAQSHVMDNVERINPSLHYREVPLLAFNHDGRFGTGNPGTSTPVAGRGAAVGDLNNDGWLDVVESVLGEHPFYFRNRGGAAHWLTIVLRGVRSNRDGYGTVVRVNGQTQYATAAGSYLCSSDKRVHFGLGGAQTTDVEVSWPSGIHQVLKGVAVDRMLEVRETATP